MYCNNSVGLSVTYVYLGTRLCMVHSSIRLMVLVPARKFLKTGIVRYTGYKRTFEGGYIQVLVHKAGMFRYTESARVFLKAGIIRYTAYKCSFEGGNNQVRSLRVYF